MFVYTKKRTITAIIAVCLVFIGAIYAASLLPSNNQNICYNYLAKLQYKTENFPIEHITVNIPMEFDAVYSNYNKIQLQGGFDLTNYRGKQLERYTYAIKNYPNATDVRANLLVYNGRVVGGDIMTLKINGFMQPLVALITN